MLIVLVLVACMHAGLWALFRGQATAPDFEGKLASVSYAPYSNSAHPDAGDSATEEQIRADLKAIAPYTRVIRTYSSVGGMELVPQVAAEFGLKVTVGAWINKDVKRNEREINSTIALARRHSNVNGIVVGNETIFRADQTVDDLIEMIKRVKRSSQVPVTTGEIWSTWIERPKLAYSVDFIAAHILPYWSNVPANQAADQAIERYNQLRRTFPGSRVVVAEFGWPSAGYNRYKSNPGRVEQAEALRTFVARAEAFGIDYNLIEAIDQPTKFFEGSVRPYWGLLDASRQAKFAWTGPINDPGHWKLAAWSVLIGFLLSLPLLLDRVTAAKAALLAISANLVGAWIAAVFAYWTRHYFTLDAACAHGLWLALLVPLVLVTLARMQEIAALWFGREPPRRIAPLPFAAETAHARPPATLADYRYRHHRLAGRTLQIVKKHWRRLGMSRHGGKPKNDAHGRLNWLAAESLGVLVAVLSLLWVPPVVLVGLPAPDLVLTLPILTAFVVTVLYLLAAYSRLRGIRPMHLLKAITAALSVRWTVAQAVAKGLFADPAQGAVMHEGQKFPAFSEAVLGTLLLLGAIALVVTNRTEVREIYVLALAFAVQSIPFVSAVAMARFDRPASDNVPLQQ